MPGFFACNSIAEFTLRDLYPNLCIRDKISIDEIGTVSRQTLNKFLDDKTIGETDQIIAVLEGYLLNRKELYDKYKTDTILNLIEIMNDTNGESFFKEFRGCFSGAVFLKKAKKWIFFTNQIGDNPVFYYCSQGQIAVGSQIEYLVDYCKSKDLELSFDENCAYQLLTYGFVANDETFANEIRRLHGGCYLVYENNKLELKTYHRFKKHPSRYQGKTESELIQLIDNCFRKAVELEWRKDDEYGYSYLADLSGGLDSRMNIWVAHELQDRHITVLTYSKSNELDELIAKQITKYWNDELLFKPLDDISFMYDVDENTRLLGGLSLYSGITGGKRLLQSLNLSNYGLEHTGQVGDAVIGSFYNKESDYRNNAITGRYSEKLSDRLSIRVKDISQQYNDNEIALLYTRGFQGACNTHLLRRNFTEVSSPFLNVDFIQLCLDLPLKARMNHKLYKKWIISTYPDAASFIWEKQGGKLTESKIRTTMRKTIAGGFSKARGILIQKALNKHGMNPIDYWLDYNETARRFLSDYEKEMIVNAKDCISEKLYNDIDWMFNTGNALEKSMALTVLSSLKLYRFLD